MSEIILSCGACGARPGEPHKHGFPCGLASVMFFDPSAVIARLQAQLAEANAKLAALDIPEVRDFMAGVPLEAAHQRKRWGTENDAGKTDADWFWLVGYLAGKALHKPEKRLHHLVTAAAALANWHAYTLGKTDMRPGIELPAGAAHG